LPERLAPMAELDPVGVERELYLLRFLVVRVLQELKNEVRRFGVLFDRGAPQPLLSFRLSRRLQKIGVDPSQLIEPVHAASTSSVPYTTGRNKMSASLAAFANWARRFSASASAAAI